MTCTGVAVVSFSVCLQVFRRHPVMSTVIRLSRGHLLPASRPAGHTQRTTSTALPPTLDQHPSADCPAGHQPTPEFQRSINADLPDALRGTNQRLSPSARFNATNRNLLDRPFFATIYSR
ncbi:hypothetical protein LF1_52510 [Rubripirellula obstinata]|uniref:Uncharacterized protein n=1 Tax=Rubripirellula obstinata TaxID=406547 RepID=A0A5B1CAU2_9BACT|nr:hypothetical protein LF1_52510 [Rubripirellula obstinata]